MGVAFSVVVPTYGRPLLVADAVRSVLDQSVTDLECIVVDDGGGELPELPADDRLRVLHRRANGGSAAARNSGLEVCTGEYVVFLDDDDWFLPTRLEAVVPALAMRPVVVCWTQDQHGRISARRRLEGHVGDRILRGFIPNVGATTVRRDRVPRFDELLRAGEDVDWWVRLADGAEVATVPEPLLVKRVHGGARPSKGAAARAAARRQLIERYADRLASDPEAASFQWRRVAAYAADAGDWRTAAAARARALRIDPSLRGGLQALRSIARRTPIGRSSP